MSNPLERLRHPDGMIFTRKEVTNLVKHAFLSGLENAWEGMNRECRLDNRDQTPDSLLTRWMKAEGILTEEEREKQKKEYSLREFYPEQHEGMLGIGSGE